MTEDVDSRNQQDKRWKPIFSMTVFHRSKRHSCSTEPSAKDLEKWSGLGPYANERRMPKWLVRVLENGDQMSPGIVTDSTGVTSMGMVRAVETPGVMKVLVRLSQADSRIQQTSYCNLLVHHVAKMRREGSFCGYRNIQMMLSYLYNAGNLPNLHPDRKPLPTIFALQKMIEEAWEQGFNLSSRDELGHLYMTRKFIGTSEIEALFLSLDIPVSTRAFVSHTEGEAFRNLIRYVHSYFDMDKPPHSLKQQVVMTQKPPIFLQRPGHSMTIIGIDKHENGSEALLVFDPKYPPKKVVKKIIASGILPSQSEKLLNSYRYGAPELGMYNAFEIVQFDY